MPGLSRVKGTKERGCIKTRQTQLYPGRYFVIHLHGCDRRNGSRPGGTGHYQQFRQRKPHELDFTAYLLTMAVTTPIFGKISDLYGRKPVFLYGSLIFLVGSLLCGLSQNMTQLIIFRAIQGIGAGAVIPVTFTIVGDIYNLEERGKIQGMISSVWGISSLIGPLLGGYFVDYLSWHWIFVLMYRLRCYRYG